MHVHVVSAGWEAKFWVTPTVQLSENHGLPGHVITRLAKILRRRRDEIEAAWLSHFGSQNHEDLT